MKGSRRQQTIDQGTKAGPCPSPCAFPDHEISLLFRNKSFLCPYNIGLRIQHCIGKCSIATRVHQHRYTNSQKLACTIILVTFPSRTPALRGIVYIFEPLTLSHSMWPWMFTDLTHMVKGASPPLRLQPYILFELGLSPNSIVAANPKRPPSNFTVKLLYFFWTTSVGRIIRTGRVSEVVDESHII